MTDSTSNSPEHAPARPSAPGAAPAASPVDPALATRERRGDWILAGLLGIAAFVIVRLTSIPVGFVRDEGYYFKAAQSYVGWYRAILSGELGPLEALSVDAIQKYFGYNHQHPALVKTMQGFTWWIWHEVLGFGLASEALRMPGPIFTAVCVAATYLLGRHLYSRAVGLFAALAWLAMPRNFFHTHLACFDVPITAMTVLTVWLYVRAGASRARAILAGIAFGLTMATKHNSLFIPPLLIIYWLGTEAWQPTREKYLSFVRPRIPRALKVLAVVGPLVFLAHWPWLWHDTLRRIGSYYGYHFLHHEHYPITYWGELLRKPPFPWGFAVGMTLVTMPLPLLGLSIWGLVLAVRDGFLTRPAQDSQALELKRSAWLLGLFGLFPIFVISLPSTPIFGGVKHWMPATPFLAILAGRALEVAVGQLLPLFQREARGTLPSVSAASTTPTAPDSHRLSANSVDLSSPAPLVEVNGVGLSAMPARGAWAVYTLTPLVLASSVAGILRSHPHGLSYYNELIGGARGAAVVGMQRHYWGEAVKPMLDTIDERLPGDGAVFFNRSNKDDFRMYQRDGFLGEGLGYAKNVEESQAAIAFHQWEHEHQLYRIWNEYGSRRAVMGVYLEGSVPLTTLYDRTEE